MTPDANAILNTVLDAIQHKHWQVLVATILVGVVAFVRWVSPKIHGKVGAFLNSDRGGSLLVLLGGVFGAISTALIAGQKINANLIFGGITTGVMASGGWNIVWDLIAPSDLKKSPDSEQPKKEVAP